MLRGGIEPLYSTLLSERFRCANAATPSPHPKRIITTDMIAGAAPEKASSNPARSATPARKANSRRMIG